MTASAIAEKVVDHMLDPAFTTNPTLRADAHELSEQRLDVAKDAQLTCKHITQMQKVLDDMKRAERQLQRRTDIYHIISSMAWAALLWGTVAAIHFSGRWALLMGMVQSW